MKTIEIILKKLEKLAKEYILSGNAILQLKKLVMSSKGNINKLNKYITKANEN